MRRFLFATILTAMIASKADAGGTATRPSASADQLFILLRGEEKPDNTIPSLLERELFRQSMLMAARDGLGLYTCDEDLRETVPPDAGDVSARTGVMRVSINNKTGRIELEFTAGTNATVSAEVERPTIVRQFPDLTKILPGAEQMSRDEFADWLHAGGFDGTAVPASDAPVPDGIEQRLGEMTIIAQYDAVRSLHAAIIGQGASPALLGALVRGYANLGDLTRFHWTGDSDVFTARSLLYAQRMVANDPQSASALWHRAYAFAMAGLPAAAMNDVSAANAMGNAAKPAWLNLLPALCAYDTEKLKDIAAANPRETGLAMFMAFMTVQNSASQAQMLETGKEAMQANPYCEQILDVMCGQSGVVYQNWLADQGMAVPVSALREELPRIADLPVAVQQAWQAAHKNPDLNADVANVSQAFVDSPELAEPSWSALGRMLQESNFVHAYRSTYHVSNLWGIDPSDVVGQTASLVKGHPFEPLIGQLSCQFNRLPAPDGLKDVKLSDANYRMPGVAIFYELKPVGFAWDPFWYQEIFHLDATAWDLELRLLSDDEYDTDQWRAKQRAKALRKIAPDSAMGAAGVVKWINDPKQLPQLSAKFSGQPTFESALASQLLKQGKQSEAIPHLQLFLKKTTDQWAYESLAGCYLAQNDEANWLATLEASLQNEDYNLDHAMTEKEIANQYMAEKKYRLAMPHADAAAESGASWAMGIAARCHGDLKEWDKANALYAEICDHYGPQAEWYFWCRYTGHGDLQAARKAALAYLANNSGDYVEEGEFYAVDRQPNDELRAVKAGYENSNEPYDGLRLAIVYDGLHDDHDRDKTLDAILLKSTSEFPDEGEAVQLAQVLQDTIKKGGDLDMATFEVQFGKLSKLKWTAVKYYAAEYLEHHGHQDQALPLLKYAARWGDIFYAPARLSRVELADMNIDVSDLPDDPENEAASATRPASKQ